MTFKFVSGALVAYRGKCAAITDIAGDKITVRLAGGETRSVRFKDIELLHPGPVRAVPPELPPAPGETLLQETVALLDGEEMAFPEFVELLWGDFSPGAAWAGCELLAADCYFTGTTADGVRANAPEKIAARLEKERQKLDQARAREALIERIRTAAVLPEDRSSLREIENVACGESTSSRLLRDLGIEALPEKAQNLLLKLGVWNLYADNPWPRRYGVSLAPAMPPWPAELPDEPRRDLTHLEAFAIDDSDSEDPDDALSIGDDGTLWVHVADPGAAATWGSELEQAACAAGGTLYLPERIVPMLPEEATAMLGLGLNATSPALSFQLRIGDDGAVTLQDLTLSRVRVARLHYEGAETLLDQEGPLKQIHGLTERFRCRRKQNGAVMIQLPEVKIRTDVTAHEVRIKPLAMNRVREMVANAMLAAGAAAAQLAAQEGFALPFAIQPEPEMSARPEDLCGMYELRKSCQTSLLSTVQGRHAGLGLEPYARVTSPLRRYEDLLAHLQLRRHLKGEAPLGAEEMDARLAVAEPAANLRRKLERQCNEYWTMVYLAARPGWQGETIPVARQDDRITWLIPELAYEFKNRFGGKTVLGEAATAVLTGVDPATLSIQFRIGR